MKILIIDNGTIHIDDIKNMVRTDDVTIIKRDQLKGTITTDFDLILLSGSSDNAVVAEPKVYENEIELIKTTPVPLIGICMGFEVIAYAYNATLKAQDQKTSGLVDIIVTDDDKIFRDKKRFTVEENHRWVVTKLKDPLVELAISQNGIEALKHKTKSIYGFQFHPEIFNEKNTGIVIFENLLKQIRLFSLNS